MPNPTMPPATLARNPIRTAFGANGKAIGQSSAGNRARDHALGDARECRHDLTEDGPDAQQDDGNAATEEERLVEHRGEETEEATRGARRSDEAGIGDRLGRGVDSDPQSEDRGQTDVDEDHGHRRPDHRVAQEAEVLRELHLLGALAATADDLSGQAGGDVAE